MSLSQHSDAVVGRVTSYNEFMMLDIASAVASFSFSVDLQMFCFAKQKLVVYKEWLLSKGYAVI